MATYAPCIYCPHSRQGCKIKAAKQAALKGHGFTSVKFRCEKFSGIFQPGQRVYVHLGTYSEEEYYGSNSYDVDLPGVIVGPHKTKLGHWVVFLDDDWKDGEFCDDVKQKSGVVSARVKRIRAIDEPAQPERLQELKRRDEAYFDETDEVRALSA